MDISLNTFRYNVARLFPKSVKRAGKQLLYSKTEFERFEGRQEDLRLRSLPRYEAGEAELLNKNIRFIDGSSFVFLRDEIFGREIYRFTADRPDPCIIDGGANIGVSTIYFKHLYPDSRLIAFEPDPKVFAVLKHNFDQFSFTGVDLVQKGLWKDDAVLNFFSEGADAGRIPVDGDDSNTLSIQTTRLSRYLNQKVDFLKLDIEGAEYEVLKECAEQLKCVEKIFIEYHSFINGEQSLPEILRILKTAGFRLYVSTPGVYSPNPFVEVRSYLGMDLQVNIFGLRTDPVQHSN